MRFLHTSDWHLGRQFHNVSLLEDQRHVLQEMFGIIQQEKIEAVLIAGDIYDRSVPPADAVALLDEVIDHISFELQIPLIIIPGNHDSAQRLSFGARQLAKSGVHIVSQLSDISHPVVLNDEHGEVAFYGIPYADPASVRDTFKCEVKTHEDAMQLLTDKIKNQHDSNQRSVVLSHCFIAGGESSESERPLSVGGADTVSHQLFSDFDYSALGHLHGPQFKGAENIRYSGSILKYSFSEARHQKSVTVVDMNAQGKCDIAKIPLKPLRNMRVIEGELDDILAQAKNDTDADDYLLVRLMDKHALYDPMAKLRAVYPNVLQIEKPNLSRGGERHQLKKENLKKGELHMFQDFYQQMTDEEMDQDGLEVVTALLDKIHYGENK